MEFFSGLDVGIDKTAICVVDDKDKVALEVTVLTDPDAIKLAPKPYRGRLRRGGHEAGSFSPRLHGGLLKLGRPALERLPGGICTHWSAPRFHGAPNADIGKDSQRAVWAITDVPIPRRRYTSSPQQTSRRLACCYKTTRLFFGPSPRTLWSPCTPSRSCR
jgi:hypothetical protein